MLNNLKETYEKRADDFSKRLKSIKNQLIVISILRFVTFIGAIFLFVLSVKQFNYVKIGIFFFLLAAFIILVIYYIKQKEILNHYQYLIDINNKELKVLQNDFSVFDTGNEYINREHVYSFDLDLFGEGSLFQYLNRTVTLVGKQFLADQLLNINQTDKQTIENRQKLITELAPKIDWRQNFMATAFAYPMKKDDNKKINGWINQPIYFLNRWFFKVIVILIPAVTLTFLGLLIAGISHYSWFVMFALIQLFIASLFMRRTNQEQNTVSEELRILKNYAKLLKLIEKEEFSSYALNELKERLRIGEGNALTAFKKLIRIIDAFDTRLNIFMGVILNATLMWDLYSVMRLERWKIKFGGKIKQWVQVIAEFDFYISMANFSFNNPNFVYPQISDKVIIDTEELGHPLIPGEIRVNNDFKISDAGKIDIVTGANMAGKSTFLRTIGANIVLAMSGMPVCANKFEFKLMNLHTGMRTADSLKENESYFYAELKRLKNIIQELKEGKQLFILLDEILKGTNSVDKAKGSWKFVEYLIQLDATGIVATHDLTLCDLEKEYPENIENKCFEVKIDGERIDFDYKLRSGVTQNMNASLLMKQMGILTN